MIQITSVNLTAPLGLDEQTCYANIKSGHSSLSNSRRFSQDDFMISCFSESDISSIEHDCHHSFFESISIYSVKKALEKIEMDTSSPRVLFIFASTKGNIKPLDKYFDYYGFNFPFIEERIFNQCKHEINLPLAAKNIARYFHNPNDPIVVSNACISGLHAQILAKELLDAEIYDHIIVVGCDLLSRFCLKGFESLKVLSKNPCKPFDMDRNGLNLGEAAGTIIFSHTKSVLADRWYVLSGAIRNDGCHNSSSSLNAEGLTRAIFAAVEEFDIRNIGVINAHGTATLYNDEMEAKAIYRTGLSVLPVNSLKGYVGHTMGASGVIEVIVTMLGLDDETIIGTKGFTESGVSKVLDIVSSNRNTKMKSFLKIISGFGGCNAAMLFAKGNILIGNEEA